MKRNRDADLLSRRLERAAEIIPVIFEHLDDQRGLVDALPARGTGGRQGGTHSDPTLRCVGQLDAIADHERDILDALASIEVGVNLLDRRCRSALGMRVVAVEGSDEPDHDEPEQRCAGGDPSTWGDPVCGQVVDWKVGDSGHVSRDPAGLCAAHRLRCDEYDRMTEEERRRAEESNARRMRRHREAMATPTGPIRSKRPDVA